MILTLQEAINNPQDCEDWQIRNWLKQLNEYIRRDSELVVQKMCLDGRRICPACGEAMALGVENFCDKCGQRILRNVR